VTTVMAIFNAVME